MIWTNNNDWNEYKLFKLIGLFKDQLDDIDRTTIFTEILLLEDLHWDPDTLRSSLRSCYFKIYLKINLWWVKCPRITNDIGTDEGWISTAGWPIFSRRSDRQVDRLVLFSLLRLMEISTLRVDRTLNPLQVCGYIILTGVFLNPLWLFTGDNISLNTARSIFIRLTLYCLISPQ